MSQITSDARYHIEAGCDMDTDYLPIDGEVEIVLGDIVGRGNAVRLVLDDIDTANALVEAARQARAILVAHLYGVDEDEDEDTPTVDEPSRDRSQPADSPAAHVERHLTSV